MTRFLRNFKSRVFWRPKPSVWLQLAITDSGLGFWMSALKPYASVQWKTIDVKSLDSILASAKGIDAVLRLKDEVALAVIDVLDQALDTIVSHPGKIKQYNTLLRKLCGSNGILPTSHTLTGLERVGESPRASGGFADVWEGRYRGRVIAIKAFKTYSEADLTKVRKRFCKEALVWKRLSHPNILPFLGIATSPFPFCIVSPWMVHGDIVGYIKSVPEANRCLLLSDIANGLNYLHSLDLVHGDLKGINILMTKDCRACIADFGLMTIVSQSATAFPALNTTSEGGGTVRWMAPELLLPEQFGLPRNLPTKQSDVYALGMVIYEVMTGSVPFKILNETAVIFKVMEGSRPERPIKGIASLAVADTVWKIAEDCWCQLRNERPEIGKVLERLNEATRYWDPQASSLQELDYDDDQKSDTSSIPSDSIFSGKPGQDETSDEEEVTLIGLTTSSDASDPIIDKDKKVLSLHDLATSSLKRFEQMGMMEDIEQSIQYLREALQLCPFGHPERHSSLYLLSHSIRERFLRTRMMEELEEAMDLARDALQLRPQGHPERLGSLSLLAHIVYDHFSHTNRTQTNDLDEVDQLTEEAFQLYYCTENDEEGELKLLHLRSRAIYNRFSRTKQMDDLEEAIELLRRSLDINTRQHDPLWRLSLALHKRFLVTYVIEDINEAITLQRFALKHCPQDKYPEYGWYLKNLAGALRARSGITLDGLDVVEAQRIDRMLHELSRSGRYRDDNTLSPL